MKEDEDTMRANSPLPSFTSLQNYLCSVNENGIPPHELHLKVGSLCSIMRNLSIDDGLVKNVQVTIQRMLHHIIEVETLPNEVNGFQTSRYLLPRINFEFQPKYCP